MANQDIIHKFQSAVARKRWSDALPLIEQIVAQRPSASACWMNFGVVLEELGRHSDAAQAFLKAYGLDPEDYGAQYRAFRSFALADDVRGFVEFAEREIYDDIRTLALLRKQAEFTEMVESVEFRDLATKVGR